MKRRPSLVALRAALLLAAAVQVAVSVRSIELSSWQDMALFALLLLGADLLWVSLPQGGEVTAGPAGVVAASLLFPPDVAIALVAGAGLLATAVRSARGHVFGGATALVQRLAALVISLPILSLGRPTSLGSARVELLSVEGLAAGLFAVAFCASCVMLGQVDVALQRGIGLKTTLFGLFGIVGPMYAALGALGALFAVVYPSMKVWAALLLLGVMLVVRHSFSLYTSVRINYQETLRALAEAIEAQDPPTRGHGERTAQLSLAVGRELGLHGRALEDLTQAALLHDIGKLATPEDSLDSLMDSSVAGGERFHAERGAEVLGQVDYLKPTAELVRHHHDRYSTSRQHSRITPLGSRIIAAAGRFDSLTHPESVETALSVDGALRRIKGGAGDEFDPRVVRALESVLRRGWVLGPGVLQEPRHFRRTNGA